ncbi:hypothetical protein PHYBLDRAFT_60637 [Phycomyces blakesleeanus NRRL 1555(-)]|uniref:Uncharacterized protein n=1 Tax=Phycomyces blakesleeanus (strain ATCC 8743b / DSM 1359 / FGSC 10004 / NBRC 33097 / NRRL 1555) TaxID=763407 RepID=A0A162US43_PHYB8|nr:hypothetical protein PHYBLDRAFT_60637 [Phycomyces blakesleeanus NRRL 1555(-)]OAD77503.1 hypothetical protein PHYBLDRAFT_60637 [Phycomyces blakesleeanus NRRL 1555(-)]|eukprot:XP_018295543.1 hypothetical protein PHYBLDRAFT_60637 [Phycomyces blakesleeanus NRRL 1555(-)]
MRKFSLNTVVNKEYKMLLRNKILITSNDLHNSISREIMFINSYCLPSSHDSIPNSIYKQTFRYLVCQLINDRKVTKSANVLPDLNVSPKDINSIPEECCYQFVCGGDPIWPICASNLQELQKPSITNTCQLLKSHIPDKVTLATLSAHLEKHISILS